MVCRYHCAYLEVEKNLSSWAEVQPGQMSFHSVTEHVEFLLFIILQTVHFKAGAGCYQRCADIIVHP